MKLNFHVDAIYQNGIARLEKLLDFVQSADGIPVYAVCGERIGASLKDGVGTVYYKDKHHFFRELGVFVENAKKCDCFDISEDTFFETVGVMFNASSAAPPSEAGAKELLDYLVVMGYNMMMLYTEDTVQLETRPYFGLFRGRYTQEELRAIDDYAFDYGIEVIPCLECYGHMSSYLKWAEAKDVKDTDSVLLARNEATFQLIEELIRTVSNCVRSKRIHIGMDEAHDMGRGAFLDKHGYVPRAEIFHEYMARLVKITDKYGLKPMMWSDMYFRFSAADGFQYYAKDTVIPEQTRKAIPQQIELVYWHYGEEPRCDEYMIEKHLDMNRHVLFAAGAWDWGTMFADHRFSLDATAYSLHACRKYGIKEIMMTCWSSQNLYANLWTLSMTAELCYAADPTERHRKERFEACTGGSYDAFFRMSNFNHRFAEEDVFEGYLNRNMGMGLFWQDILEGVYEHYLKNCPMSDYYRANAETMKQYHGKFEDLYRFSEKCFEFLAVKTEVAQILVDAYKAGDKQTLAYISNDLLPQMKELIQEIRLLHLSLWRSTSKIMGWYRSDHLYGGMAARCDTAKMLIDEYVAGKIDRIEELDEPHLPKYLNGFDGAYGIAMPV